MNLEIEQRVKQAFFDEFGERPSHIIRAPGRVNLIGEHTDYNDGFVLPMAIDRAVWLAIQPRSDRHIHVHSLDFEETAVIPLDNLQKGRHHWSEYLKGMAWALQEAGYPLNGWKGVLAGDVPLGAGLSSSAALEMAVACALATVSGFAFDGPVMAKIGQRAENEWVGANTGIMDQMISANGRTGHALLIDCRDLSTQAIPLPEGTAILILDTMTRHNHTESGYNERRTSCEQAANFFSVPALRDVSLQDFLAREKEIPLLLRKRARHVISENVRTLNAVAALQNGDARMMGRLMNDSHSSLRDDFEVTNEQLDMMASIAQGQSGCFGARMTGGGFGGCAVALVKTKMAEEMRSAVAHAYETAAGLTPQIYITQASDGAALVSSS